MTYLFAWKEGSRISADAQAGGEMCAQLEREGRLTAKNLVEANRDENAPLHNEFEWDDNAAAEKFREEQARYIIRHLTIVREPEAETKVPTTIRAFYQVESGTSNYDSVVTIMSSEQKYSSLLQSALNELRSFQKKYREIKELDAIMDCITDLLGGKAV